MSNAEPKVIAEIKLKGDRILKVVVTGSRLTCQVDGNEYPAFSFAETLRANGDYKWSVQYIDAAKELRIATVAQELLPEFKSEITALNGKEVSGKFAVGQVLRVLRDGIVRFAEVTEVWSGKHGTEFHMGYSAGAKIKLFPASKNEEALAIEKAQKDAADAACKAAMDWAQNH